MSLMQCKHALLLDCICSICMLQDKRKSDVLALVVEAARRTNEELQGNVQRTATKLVRSKATIRHLRSQASTQASVYGEDMKVST